MRQLAAMTTKPQGMMGPANRTAWHPEIWPRWLGVYLLLEPSPPYLTETRKETEGTEKDR